jgi:outer membrane protein assembly factor BamB
LIVSGGGYVTGHDLTTGREMWRGGGLDPDRASNYRTIASTLVVGDIALVPSRRRPFIAFGLDGKGQVPQRLWSTEYGPDVPTPTSDGERLYIVDDRGIALCLRVADGSVVWDRSRLEPGTYSASPVLADGKIYATNEDGTTTVFKAGDTFEILAVNKLNDYTLASPAVAGEHIFLRTANYLYCFGKQGPSSD